MSLFRGLYHLWLSQPRKGQHCDRCAASGHLVCTPVPDEDVPVLAVYTEMHSAVPTEEAA